MADSDPLAGRWSIIVHGGAKDIPVEDAPAYRSGCERACAVGSEVLASGGTAIDAVVAAIRVLEDDPTFNAGTGAVRNSDGETELDAAIMDGARLDVGGVAALRGARNPILAARAMLRSEETLLVADGAAVFAREHAPQSLLDSPDETRTAAGGDTVGCVAVDHFGDIAAGTSTGGLAGSPPGRVGDSPIPGAGLYAENSIGGVALSGYGERISRVTLAAWTIAALHETSAPAAARSAMIRLERVEGEGGIVVIDGEGRIGWAHNSSEFAVAYATSDRDTVSFIRSDSNGPSNEEPSSA